MKLSLLIPLVLVLVVLSGCVATSPNRADVPPNLPSVMTLIDTADFGPRPELLPVEQIFTLSGPDKSYFQDFYDAPERKKVSPHIRVFDFLTNKLQSFDYDHGTFS
ncbi:MAG: hypothetical protein HRT35_36235, partial [Algicola sp.]|nr:hypothetical protein [Algicola sp.]